MYSKIINELENSHTEILGILNGIKKIDDQLQKNEKDLYWTEVRMENQLRIFTKEEREEVEKVRILVTEIRDALESLDLKTKEILERVLVLRKIVSKMDTEEGVIIKEYRNKLFVETLLLYQSEVSGLLKQWIQLREKFASYSAKADLLQSELRNKYQIRNRKLSFKIMSFFQKNRAR